MPREGAAQASTGENSGNKVKTVVLQYMEQAGLPTTNAVVTVKNQKTGKSNPKKALQGEPLQVTVSLPLADVQWVNTSSFFSSGTTVSNSCVWICREDGVKAGDSDEEDD